MTWGISAKVVGSSKGTCSLMLVRPCLTSTVDMVIAHQTTGFLIIWSKFSDIFGRKVAFISTASIFVIFSGACGASRTITELVRETSNLLRRIYTYNLVRIVFRAFQGIGASGCYALAVVMSFELVPRREWPTYMALAALALVLAMGLGPLFGGAINIRGDWRWVFLIEYVPPTSQPLLTKTSSIPPELLPSPSTHVNSKLI